MHRFRHLLAWAALAVFATPCLAQSPTASPRAASAPIGHSIHADGIGRLVPGQWGSVGVNVINPGDHPVDVLSVIFFPNQSTLQFGRRLWLPPRARLSTSFPVLTPENLSRQEDSVDVQTLLLDRTGTEEVLIKSSSGQMLGDAALPVLLERPTTGVIDDEGDEVAAEAVMAMRLSRNLTRRLSMHTGDFFPSTPESLQGLDNLVLMSDRLARDSAGLSAVRQWLHSGGRLWIMLDQVSADTVSALLGDGFTYHAVDRVGLTNFTMKSTLLGGLGPQGLTQESEEPIDFVRVLTSQGRVIHTINDWPASFFVPIGRGLVMFTTVGPRAWIRPRGPGDSRPTDPLRESRSVANDLLSEIAFEFMGELGEPAPLKPADFQNFVSEQIGYRIVSRGMALLVLGTFCTLLIACGVWLGYRQMLPHLGWLGPLTAVVAAAMLVLLGTWSRREVPATVAVAQFAEISRDSDNLQLTGLMALYQQAETSSPLGAENGGVFLPDTSGQDGKTRRLVWTDLGKWHWENLTLPAGLRRAPFRYSGRLEKPVSARATFGPAGLMGTLEPGPFQDLADALVVMPGQPLLAAHLGADGQFTAGSADVLAEGEFIGGTILNDERRRRRAVFKKMLEIPGRESNFKVDEAVRDFAKVDVRTYPSEPLLLVWASPYDMQFTLPTETQRVGSALLAIPLTFDHPAPGTSFVIPSPCVTFESVGNSGAYLNREQRWIEELNTASTTTLRFRLPREVLPLKLKQALLTITLNAPGRTLSITGGSDAANPVVLATRSSPVGTVQLNIDRADTLTLKPDGTFEIGIDVGTAQGEVKDPAKGIIQDFTNFPVWRIESVQLEVTGVAE